MSQFISTSMPRGFAGQITRGFFDNTVEVKEAAAVIPAGSPVKLSGGKVAACSAAADAVIGFAVREYGQADLSGNQEQQFVGVLRRGYIAVKLASGTASAGAQAYLTAAGAISAASSGNTAITGCKFCGKADADGIVEIEFNI